MVPASLSAASMFPVRGGEPMETRSAKEKSAYVPHIWMWAVAMHLDTL